MASLELRTLQSGVCLDRPLRICQKKDNAYLYLRKLNRVWISTSDLSKKSKKRWPFKAPILAALEPNAEVERVDDVIIVGAGISGLATALALHKVGISSKVLESAPTLREGGSALSLWTNAWRALNVLGVAQELRDYYSPLTRVELCSKDGPLLRQFPMEDCEGGPHEVRGVRRGALLSSLANGLPEGTIEFGARLAGLEKGHDGTTLMHMEDGRQLAAKVVVGCDGTNSVVASALHLPPAKYAGYSAFRGVAHFVEGHNLGQTIRQVLGQGVRAGMYPITEHEAYWFTCFNASPGIRETDPEARKAAALSSVKGWAFGIENVIQNTPATSVTYSDICDRAMATQGRWGRGGITLAGDAAHPMTPNLGQGGCTALEDAIVFARELSTATVEASNSSALNNFAGPVIFQGVPVEQGQDVVTKQPRRQRVLGSSADVEAALARYEVERSARCEPLTSRAHKMGILLQIPFWPVCFVRDNIAVPVLFQPNHFLDHTLYDCGTLPEATLKPVLLPPALLGYKPS